MSLNLFFLVTIAICVLAKRPNIVLILTDDQDVVLGSLEPMNKTLQFLRDGGARVENAFVTTPVCCPSRSSMLTGMYIHTHGSTNNTLEGGCSSRRWQELYEPRSYARHLNDAGYRTFYAGKYLNMYGSDSVGGTAHIPKGWDWWFGLVGNSVYYNYQLSMNGTSKSFGEAEEDYLPDVLKGLAVNFLSESYVTGGEDPFLMVVSTPTPHAPFTPAARHKGTFSGVKAPRTPHFNIPATDRKHWMMRMLPETLPAEVIDIVDSHYRDRWEALLAVDELVEAIVLKLNETKILDDTYIIYFSDNGFHFGQFAQAWDKRQPYEFDTRVPMLVRGPGISPGTVIHDVALSIDLAPTLLDIGGVKLENETDGVSFLSKLLQNPPLEDFDRTFLIEYRGEGTDDIPTDSCSQDHHCFESNADDACKCRDTTNNTYVCIRHLSNKKNDVYCRFEDDEDFAELYDLNADPYELENLARPNLLKDVKPYTDVLSCYDEKVSNNLLVASCWGKTDGN